MALQAPYVAEAFLTRHKFAGARHQVSLAEVLTLERPDSMMNTVRIHPNRVSYSLQFRQILMAVAPFATVNLAQAKFVQFLEGAEV
jgi:hypothetical protein